MLKTEIWEISEENFAKCEIFARSPDIKGGNQTRLTINKHLRSVYK
ncbi:hypothetical protein PORCRE_1739 [Porphyromonas crevioricanis JCM 15906]|uniref:Uncharacterized protein n=1 Tax=Porphyromonas crevioricanis JCM 15906 TaxID=1305617 RepID=T1DTU8_9PORP|nr:hypothetical protein PORCRE_1739 [Porphyromonas crevioricanis JCM 15906]